MTLLNKMCAPELTMSTSTGHRGNKYQRIQVISSKLYIRNSVESDFERFSLIGVSENERPLFLINSLFGPLHNI